MSRFEKYIKTGEMELTAEALKDGTLLQEALDRLKKNVSLYEFFYMMEILRDSIVIVPEIYDEKQRMYIADIKADENGKWLPIYSNLNAIPKKYKEKIVPVNMTPMEALDMAHNMDVEGLLIDAESYGVTLHYMHADALYMMKSNIEKN